MTYRVNVLPRDVVVRWVQRALFGPGETFSDPNAQAIGLYNNNNDLVAGVVYHNWSPSSGSIEMSAYSTTRVWANKSVVRLLFDYPFLQVGCRIVVARHAEDNTHARRIWSALGASEHIIPDLRADGLGEAIAVLRKETWLNSKFKRSEQNGKRKIRPTTT